MESFHWDDCFLTGLATVDEQHRGLVDLINRLGGFMVRLHEAESDELAHVLSALVTYAKVHFHDEEAVMAAAQLDPGYIRRHHHEHARFLADVQQLHRAFEGSRQQEVRALLSYLTHWLTYHILGSDQLMAWMMATAHTGASAEEAYRAFQKDKDPATAMLLQSLDQMFQQVSEHNRALQALNQTLETRVNERTQALRAANQRLEELAMTDVLTGLGNRRHALLTLHRHWLDAQGAGTPLACMVIDADGFKSINDTHGHWFGDEVLRQLAQRLDRAVRTDDQVFRMGGDEFLILCRNTPLAGALCLAEKVRESVAGLWVRVEGGGTWQGSISVGVAASGAAVCSVEQLLKSADEGVYLAKRQGRNAVASVQ